MEIRISERDTVAVVSVVGDINSSTVSKFSTTILEEAYRHSNIVLEMERVEYINSACLQVLLTTLKTCQVRGGDLRLANVQPNVQRVLRVSGITSMLKTYMSIDDAIASFPYRK